jgi:hypothetical protein
MLDEDIPRVVYRPATSPRSKIDLALAFLERNLTGGAKPASQLIAAAKLDHAISYKTLRRAKRRLGIRAFQACGRWMWTSF